MKVFTNTNEFKGGWWIGNFEPSVFKTKDFEVCYKFHPKGEIWPKHKHEISDEFNYLMEGEMYINDTRMIGPTIFVVEKGETARPEFLTDCKIIVVKVPSVPNDKIEEK